MIHHEYIQELWDSLWFDMAQGGQLIDLGMVRKIVAEMIVTHVGTTLPPGVELLISK